MAGMTSNFYPLKNLAPHLPDLTSPATRAARGTNLEHHAGPVLTSQPLKQFTYLVFIIDYEFELLAFLDYLHPFLRRGDFSNNAVPDTPLRINPR